MKTYTQTRTSSLNEDLAAAAAALIQKTRWKHTANGHWKFNTPAYLATLTPIGITRNGQSRISAEIALRRAPSYAIATATLDGVTVAKTWVEGTIEAIASAGTGTVSERIEFEVAVYVDDHPNRNELDNRLNSRMLTEARRLKLDNPRKVAEFNCSKTTLRLARVWTCEGERTISAGAAP